MTNIEQLKKLYREQIIPYSTHPYHFEKRAEASKTFKAYNPLCGDKFELYVTLENDLIKSIYFHGFGCAISKASTSILAKKAEGMIWDDFMILSKDFLNVIANKNDTKFEDKTLNILNEIKHYNGRMDCVKLSWEALCRD